MGRKPPTQKRGVALAAVDVDLAIGVFTVAVDDVFAGVCVEEDRTTVH
jgi:hypothetical protein